MKLKKILKVLLFLVPLICGTIGYYILEKDTLSNALFYCVLMYSLNYGYVPPNVLVDIARWTAPLVSAYSILLIASALRSRLSNFLRSRRTDAVAVYGPEEYTIPMLEALGKKGVRGGDAPSGAGRHILLWDEAGNLAFYDRNKSRLTGKDVYLKSSSIPSQAAAGADLHIFCPEETAARLFWKDAPLCEASLACGHRMKIILIGFGRLGSEVLTCALQNNIFSPGQRIEYHVFGGDPSYLKIRSGLNVLCDPIVFHEEPWSDCLPLLESATRMIVLQQEDQTTLLSELLLALRTPVIYVFSSNDAGLGIIDGNGRIRCFPWKDAAFKPENILSEDLYRRAKSINLRYAHLYSGVGETAENLDAEWKKLDTFTRYSNISSADYHEIRLKMLKAMREPEDPELIAPGLMELLAELEHMRWCRYHLLNNWSFGIPENGKSKDSALRIHSDLKPYDQLTEAEKQKDRDTVRLLLELGNEQNA